MVEHESKILARRKFDSVEAYKHVGEEDDVKNQRLHRSDWQSPLSDDILLRLQDYPLFDF